MLRPAIFILALSVISTAFALFGDGDPANGFEDDRELLSAARGVLAEYPDSVGTIFCEIENLAVR
jgi:hypothetical protein